jgi:hypothetical protein
VAIAPASFGPLAGDALLTVDAGTAGGALVAMTPGGATQRLASFPGDGPNPIVPIPSAVSSGGTPPAGVYITDDETRDVYDVSAAQLAPYAGDLFVSTEIRGDFWIIAPKGGGVTVTALPDDLTHRAHGIEGAVFVG